MSELNSSLSDDTIRNPSQDGRAWVEEMEARFPVEYTQAAPPATVDYVTATSSNPAFKSASRFHQESKQAAQREAALKRFMGTLCEDEDELRLLSQATTGTVDVAADGHMGDAGDEEMQDMNATTERAPMIPTASTTHSKRLSYQQRRSKARKLATRTRSVLYPSWCGAQRIYIFGILAVLAVFLVVPVVTLTQMYAVSQGRESFGLRVIDGPVTTAATLANVNQLMAVMLGVAVPPSLRPLSEGGALLTYDEVNGLLVEGIGARSVIPSDLFSTNGDLQKVAAGSTLGAIAATIATTMSWAELVLDPSRLLAGPLSGVLRDLSLAPLVQLVDPSVDPATATEESLTLSLRQALSGLLARSGDSLSNMAATLLLLAQQATFRSNAVALSRDLTLSLTTSLLAGRTTVAYTMPTQGTPTGILDKTMSQLELLSALATLQRWAHTVCHPHYSDSNASGCNAYEGKVAARAMESISVVYRSSVVLVMQTLSKLGEGGAGWRTHLSRLDEAEDHMRALVEEAFGGQVYGFPLGALNTSNATSTFPDSLNLGGGFLACNDNLRRRFTSLSADELDSKTDFGSPTRAQYLITHQASRNAALVKYLNFTDDTIAYLLRVAGNVTSQGAPPTVSRTVTHSVSAAVTPTVRLVSSGEEEFEVSTLGFLFDCIYALRRMRVLHIEVNAIQNQLEQTTGLDGSDSGDLLDTVGYSVSDSLRTLQSGSPLSATLSPTSPIAALMSLQKLLEASLESQIGNLEDHFAELEGGARDSSDLSFLRLPAHAATHIQTATAVCVVAPALILLYMLYGLSLRTRSSFLPHKLLLIILTGMYLLLVGMGGVVGGVGVDVVRSEAHKPEERAHWAAVKRDLLGVAYLSNETANAVLLSLGIVTPSDIFDLYDGLHRLDSSSVVLGVTQLTSSALLAPSLYSTITSNTGVNPNPLILGDESNSDAINSTALVKILEIISGNSPAAFEEQTAPWRTLQNVTCAAESILRSQGVVAESLSLNGCNLPFQRFPLMVASVLVPALESIVANASQGADTVTADFTKDDVEAAIESLEHVVSPFLVNEAMRLVTQCGEEFATLNISEQRNVFLSNNVSQYRYCNTRASGSTSVSMLRQRDGASGFLLAGGMTARLPFAVGPFAIPNGYTGNNTCQESTGNLVEVLGVGTLISAANETRSQVQSLLNGVAQSYSETAIQTKGKMLLRRRVVVWVSGLVIVAVQLLAAGVYLLVFDFPVPSSLVL